VSRILAALFVVAALPITLWGCSRTSAALPWHSNDTYQLMLDQDDANPGRGVARQAAALTHYHEKVAGAEDDPAWARPMEQRVRKAILADPVAERLQIASVACRKTGCEVQLFETHPSAKPTDLPAWFQAVERIRKSDLGAAIEMAATFGARDGDRIMYVTTFKRKP
jgi:hypothetical protein